MATLTVTDDVFNIFPPYQDPVDITDIVFDATVDKTISANAEQFDGTHISPNVHVVGDAHANGISVSTFTAPGNTFSAATWTFDNWSSNDFVRFFGTGDNDTITGSIHNDVFESLSGSDTLSGLDGDDSFFFSGTDDNPFVPVDVVDGGAGNDTVRYSNFFVDAEAVFYFTQFTSVETLEVQPIPFNDGPTTLLFNGDQVGGTTGFTTVRQVDGGQFDLVVIDDEVDLSNVAFLNWTANLFDPANTIRIEGLNSGSNHLIGSELSDTVGGGDFADSIDGGVSADFMIGGNGDDTYFVDNHGDIVLEQFNGGFDTVFTTVSITIPGNVERLVLPGDVSGGLSGNEVANFLEGGSANDTLDGAGGNDTLVGGAGVDVMIGGVGDDTYTVADLGDTVTELAGGGTDLVQSSITYTLGAQVENLALIGGGAINGTGNDAANLVTGNSGANLLSGLGGQDVINGSDGNDTVTGGGARDWLTGGIGNDQLTGGAGYDYFVFRDGDGNDVVTDFDNSHDIFDLTGVAGVHSFGDLTLTDLGQSILVSYGTGSFRITNLSSKSPLDASDFLFAPGAAGAAHGLALPQLPSHAGDYFIA